MKKLICYLFGHNLELDHTQPVMIFMAHCTRCDRFVDCSFKPKEEKPLFAKSKKLDKK